MPILRFEENIKLPLIGKIRLGIRQENTGYPKTVEYFVLDDAPYVADVYGNDPKELDVMFVSDDMELSMPYYLKWYGSGVKGKDGSIIAGKLKCYGDGKTATYLEGRDPVTRVAPTRECKYEQCPDWKDGKGNPQCKPSMSVYVMLPRVSLRGFYRIDTTSQISIDNFVSLITTLKNTWGTFKMQPFTIYREETATRFMDKNGQERQGVQYIMKIRPNETFQKQYGGELTTKIQTLQALNYTMPNAKELIEAPMEDHFPVVDAAQLPENTQAQTTATKVDLATQLAEDADVLQLFSELCTLKQRQNNQKTRILTIRKFENSPDVKAATIAYLKEEIEKAKPAQTPPTEPAISADGLI